MLIIQHKITDIPDLTFIIKYVTILDRLGAIPLLRMLQGVMARKPSLASSVKIRRPLRIDGTNRTKK
jgi:hypothetical protein